MVELDFAYISVGFISYMSLYWVADVAFSFFTEFKP